MAKAKSQASLDLTGRMAKQWNEEATKAHKKARDYNEVRRDRTEKLRRAVTEVWAALEAGKTVNGCTGKEEWARWYSENARTKNPIRQIQKIIAGPKPKEANSVRPLIIDLRKNPTIIFIDYDGAKYESKKVEEGNGTVHVEHNKKYSDAIRFALKEIAKPEEKEQAVAAPVQPAPVAKKTPSQKQGEQAIKNMEASAAKKKERKTHIMRPDGSAWCSVTGNPLFAKDGEEATCKVCPQQEHMAKLREWGKEFDALVPAGLSRKEKDDRWADYCHAKQGYVRGEGYEWVPDAAKAQEFLLLIETKSCPEETL